MGFTIDMVSGETVDESVAEKSDTITVNERISDMSEYSYTEQLISVIEPGSDILPEMSMPESIVQTDIDSFLDKI